MQLQRLAGNAAVAGLFVQREAPAATLPADAPTREAAPPAAAPPKSIVIPPPPPLTGVPDKADASEGPHPGVDLAADAKSVTVTLVYKDWNFPESADDAVIDWMHEPNVSIQVDPKNASAPVVQAAIAAINVHLQHHGKDLIEFSANPQVGVPTDDPGGTSVGVQGQAELHITAKFSITASSTVSGARNKATGRVDVMWDPISIGVLYHVWEKKGKEDSHHAADQADDTIGWIESNFDASTLDDGGRDENLKEGEDAIIARMIAGMNEAKGQDVAQVDIDLGPHSRALPDRLEQGLTQLVKLIKFSHPQLESIATVRVRILRKAPGSSETTLWRMFELTPGPDPGVPGDYPTPSKRKKVA